MSPFRPEAEMVPLQLKYTTTIIISSPREYPRTSCVVSLPVWRCSCACDLFPLRVCTIHTMASRLVRPVSPCHQCPASLCCIDPDVPTLAAIQTHRFPLRSAFVVLVFCATIKVIADETTQGPGTADDTPPPMGESTTLPPMSETAPPSMGGTEMTLSEVIYCLPLFRFSCLCAIRG